MSRGTPLVLAISEMLIRRSAVCRQNALCSFLRQEDGTALVKLLPNVQEPFLIQGPQLIEGGHEIVLVKHGGSWGIWAMR